MERAYYGASTGQSLDRAGKRSTIRSWGRHSCLPVPMAGKNACPTFCAGSKKETASKRIDRAASSVLQESGHMDRLRWLVLSAFMVFPASAAEPPRVQFDMPYAVACRDVTPADYSVSHPGHKLLEAKLEISALLVAGQEKD